MSSGQVLDVYLLTICLVVNYMSSGQVVGVGYFKRIPGLFSAFYAYLRSVRVKNIFWFFEVPLLDTRFGTRCFPLVMRSKTRQTSTVQHELESGGHAFRSAYRE